MSAEQTFYRARLEHLKDQRAGTLSHLENRLVNRSEPALLINVYQIDVCMCMEVWPETCFHYDLLTRLQRKAEYCPFKCS